MKYFETKTLLQVLNGVNPLRAIILQRLGGTEAQRQSCYLTEFIHFLTHSKDVQVCSVIVQGDR